MICRLCLQTISNNNDCQPVEEPLLKSLKLNMNICKENVMCIDCASCLRVFSNFTPSCAYKGEGTLPLSDPDNVVKLEPEAVATTTSPKSFMKTEIKCSFCTQAHGRENLISLTESKDNKVLVDMLERYFLETNLKMTEELLTCETCLETLQGGSNVISKCLAVEEKISKYIELQGTDDKGRVELKEMQRFMFGSIIKSEIGEKYTGVNEAEIKSEKEINNTELIIKSEDDDIEIERDDCATTDIKSVQSECEGFQELFIENENPSETKMLQCEFCPYQTKWKHCIARHLLTHKNPSEIKMFKCEFCSFQAKRKDGLTNHLLIHKNLQEIKMFECAICSHKTKRKSDLKHHLLTHKSPSEIKQVFKCELCSFETKRKRQFSSHLLTHKNPSDINMFKCDICPYETKYKSALAPHSLTHKIPQEIKMYVCEICSYETKRTSRIEDHLLTHKSPSEINMFKCELCSYEAKWKRCLKRHLLIHKSPSEIDMFKCEFCPYETKYKSALTPHLLIHKSPSEVNMFKCEFCPYEAKLKIHLKKHLLTHRSSS